MQDQIIDLVNATLNEKEIAIAERLDFLIQNREMLKAWALLEQILPIFWKRDGDTFRTISPTGVYRTLYYLNEPYDFIRSPRHMITLMGNHLEGLLGRLLDIYNRPLGVLARLLTRTEAAELSCLLLEFNKVYVRAKHMSGDLFLETRLDRRTFSTREAVFCFVVARNLSIKLMELLRDTSKALKQEWKQFNSEWLTWDREEPVSLGRNVIPLREHPET